MLRLRNSKRGRSPDGFERPSRSGNHHTPPNTPHFGRNATNRISKTLVIRVKDKDKPIMVEIKK